MKINFTLFFIFFSYVGFSQYIDTKVITANEGLFSNNIQKTFIDSEGTLWIGSRAGLSKRKMNSFEIVNEASNYKFNNIFDINQDKEDRMWIAGYGQGVLCIDKQSSRLINTKSGLVNDFVRVVYPLKDKIYVGTLNGLSIISVDDFSIKNPKFIQNPEYEFTITSFFTIKEKIYFTTLNDGVYCIENQELIKVNDIKKIFSSFVWNDKIYLGTEKELLVLNAKNFKVISKYKVPNIWQFYTYDNILSFISSGIYANDGGIFRLVNDKVVNRVEALKVPFLDLKSFSFDKKNEFLYIGTQNNGLIQINLNSKIFHQENFDKVYSVSNYKNKEFIFHDGGFSILQDNKITKNVSLSKFKNLQVEKYKKFKDLAVISNHFYPIDYNIPADKIQFYNSIIFDNQIWVSSNLGMFRLTLNGDLIDYYPVHVYIFTFFQGKLVTVVPYGGIRVFNNIETMNYNYYHNYNNPNIPADIVSIANINDRLYFASALSGLYEYKNGEFKSFADTGEFSELKLKRITCSNQENLIVVTDFNDVYELKISQPKIEIINQISHNKIKGSTTAFVHDIDDVLYIGTNLGLNVFYNNKYFFINKSQGLTDYNINKASVIGSKLYVLTSKGYFVLDNSMFKNIKSRNNTAEISNIYVNNTSYDLIKNKVLSNGLILNYNENNINLFFTVPNEKFPDKLKFKYRLKTSEPWIDLINDNQIILSYLDRGSYDLQIQISNEDTGDVFVQRLIKIDIQPPFYLKLPFVLFSIFCLIVIVIIILKVRVRVIKKAQEKEFILRSLQSENEKKELLFDKQLAEVKLQALKSQMNSHFLFNVLSSIQYFIISRDIDNALYYLERFSNLIRRTLDFSDKKTISLSEEIDYLKQYIEIENIRVENEIDFNVFVDSNINLNDIKIAPLLLQPFIENSIVHAFPESILHPEIQLVIEKDADKIKILIIDNGIGSLNVKESTHDSKGITIVNKRLELTQKNFKNNVKILFSDSGTKVEIHLDF